MFQKILTSMSLSVVSIFLAVFALSFNLFSCSDQSGNRKGLSSKGHDPFYNVDTYNISYKALSYLDLSTIFNENKASSDRSSASKFSKLSPNSLNAEISITLDKLYLLKDGSGEFVVYNVIDVNANVPDDNSKDYSVIENDPFLVQYNKYGNIVNFWFSDKLLSNNAQKNLLKSLVGFMQVVIKDGSTEWVSKEFDLFGEYSAKYSFLNDDNSLIKKSKILYTKEDSIDNPYDTHISPNVLILNSNFTIRIDESKKVESIVGSENQDIYSSDMKVGTNKFKINIVKDAKNKKIDSAKFRTFKSIYKGFVKNNGEKLYLPISKEQREKEIYETEASGVDINNLFSKLRKYEQRGKEDVKTSELSYLFTKFKALIYTDPDNSMPVIRREIEEYGIGSLTSDFFMRVLCAVGTNEAQVFLQEKFEESKDKKNDARYYLECLGSLVYPSIGTERFLFEVFNSAEYDDELCFIAGYALGSYAKKLSYVDKTRSEKIVKYFIDLLRESSDDSQKTYFIRVLGNTGSESILPVLSDYLQDKNNEITHNCIMSLRYLVELPKVKNIFIRFLEDDSDIGLKINIVKMFKNIKPSEKIINAQLNATMKDDNKILKLKVLDNLSDKSIREMFPRAQKFIEMAANNKDPDISNLANKILKKYP